ncbi:MAG TPA: radical SAM protein [Steroidobacteraceae bacterium]|jgi:anaerobic magnesium-protoporphyrin IX monomethyl ester cyclase|nr:radical SAM protein [Steroidobacteraceae bacterium]
MNPHRCGGVLTRTMLSILLGHSYFLRLDHKQWKRAKPYPPLATLQVAARLRALGHGVDLFDAMLADGTGEYERQLRRVVPQLVLLYEDNYNFLTKMCLARMREAACRMVEAARRAGARVIVAGSDATDAPEAYLAAGADAVLAGEGIEALEVLLERLDACPSIGSADLIRGVPGVSSALDATSGRVAGRPGGTRIPPARGELPPPAWDLIDVERYRAVWRRAHGHFSLNMAASRGCSFRCSWCAKPIWGNHYLQRPAADVAAEMTRIKRDFAPDHIWFADDIFGFRIDWVSEFAAALAVSGGSIPFTIQSRADLISERMAAALYEAGCREAWLGAESGSQRVLDAMNKGTRVAEINTARHRLGAAGIRVGFFIQLGYLGEELSDILATRELIETAQPDDVGVSVAYPLPGTKFHDLVRAQLGDKTHWEASGELAMMFQGTYTSPFYREVRDLLHEEVRISSQGLALHGAIDRARRSLRRRWDHLLACQETFLNATPGTVATAPAAGFP